jgi:endonuclease/exonuclease/phosphatase (EEP) superfamily protein YafD
MNKILPVLIILYLCSLLGELGSFWWVFDLFSHWRIVYLLGGTLLVLLALLFKQIKWAFVAGVVLSFHLIVVSAFIDVFPQTQPVRAAEDTAAITVAFTNTYWKQESMDQVITGIKEMNADVIFLEEIQPDQFATVSAHFSQEYPFALHAPVEFAFDMGVLSKVPVKSQTIHFFMPEVPLIEIVVEVNGKDLHLMGVHPHSPVSAEFTEDRNNYLKDLFAYVDNSPDSIVMGGDFNITQFSPVYRELLANSRMIDTQKNFKLTSTWPTKAPLWVAIPIDHVFVTPDVIVSERYRGAYTGSDHWPIVVRVGL